MVSVASALRPEAGSRSSSNTPAPSSTANHSSHGFKSMGQKVLKALKEHHEKSNAAFEAMYGVKERR